MYTIIPFKFKGAWVFDEKQLGLDKEQFVNGADKIIELIGQDIHDYENGFELTFSPHMLSWQSNQNTYSLTFSNSEFGGSWYVLDRFNLSGWLCPALFKFFPTAPEKLYVRVSEATLADRLIIRLKKKFSLKNPIVMT